MCSRKFSPSDDLRLINSVKAFPVLFNHERTFVSKNPDIIRENWRAVASAVGKDEESCRKRWRDIRDHYFKVKRKVQASKGQRWTTRWHLYKNLSFLAHAKRKKRHPSEESFSDQDLAEDSNAVDIYQPEMTFKVEEDSQMQTKCPTQPEYVDVVVSSQREADSSYPTLSDTGNVHFLEDPRPSWGPPTLVEAFSETRRQDGEDDVDVFMRSVALTVKRLPPKARADAKLKILSLVTTLEFPAGVDVRANQECS